MTHEQFAAEVERIRKACERVEPVRQLQAEREHVEAMLRVTSEPPETWACSVSVHTPQGNYAIHPTTDAFRRLIRATLKSHLADVSASVVEKLKSL